METVSLPSDIEVEKVNIIFCIIIICMHAWMNIPTTSPTPHTHIHLKIEPEMKEVEKDSRDSRGISSWDRVDRLARALVNRSGLCEYI